MTQIRETEIPSGNASFKDKRHFLNEYRPLLEQVAEYRCTGVMERAEGLFNRFGAMHITKKQAEEGIPEAREIYDQRLREFTTLQANHPEEWKAWQTHGTYADIFLSGIRQGFMTVPEWRALEQKAEQEYRKTHK